MKYTVGLTRVKVLLLVALLDIDLILKKPNEKQAPSNTSCPVYEISCPHSKKPLRQTPLIHCIISW